MSGLFPLSRMQQFDENGELLIGARLFLFDGGTTTPRVGYRDSSLSTEHPNPIVADSAGRLPLIYLEEGFYRQRLTTATGVVVFDDDGIPVLSSAEGGTGTSVDPNATFGTRDIKIRFDDQPIAGYVRLNGRTIGSAGSGATERANADTQPLYEELWSYANITVSGGKGATAPGDFAANKPLALPNCAGRGIFGADDLGAGAQSILTATTITGPTLIGSSGGSQTVTIAQGNVPNYTLTGGSGSVSISGTAASGGTDHGHTISGTTGGATARHHHAGPTLNYANVSGGGPGTMAPFLQNGTLSAGSGGIGNTGDDTPDHAHAMDFSSGGASAYLHTHPVSGSGSASSISISSGGSGTAITNLPPIMTFMIYIRL